MKTDQVRYLAQPSGAVFVCVPCPGSRHQSVALMIANDASAAQGMVRDAASSARRRSMGSRRRADLLGIETGAYSARLRRENANAHLGTPQTRQRLKSGGLERMIRSGDLTDSQSRAARQIEAVWKGLCGALGIRAPKLEHVDGSSLGSMTEKAALHYTIRFKPWATLMEHAEAVLKRDVIEMVRRAVLEDETWPELDKAFHMRAGSSRAIVTWALAVYALCAGWVRHHDVEQVEHQSKSPKVKRLLERIASRRLSMQEPYSCGSR